nr:hypothetical protein [Paenibacillus kribbensis]
MKDMFKDVLEETPNAAPTMPAQSFVTRAARKRKIQVSLPYLKYKQEMR